MGQHSMCCIPNKQYPSIPPARYRFSFIQPKNRRAFAQLKHGLGIRVKLLNGGHKVRHIDLIIPRFPRLFPFLAPKSRNDSPGTYRLATLDGVCHDVLFSWCDPDVTVFAIILNILRESCHFDEASHDDLA